MKCSSHLVAPILQMEPKENGINIDISFKTSVKQTQVTSVSVTRAAEKKEQKATASVVTRSKSADNEKQSDFFGKPNLYQILNLDIDASREESTFLFF